MYCLTDDLIVLISSMVKYTAIAFSVKSLANKFGTPFQMVVNFLNYISNVKQTLFFKVDVLLERTGTYSIYTKMKPFLQN